jgi:hypothetical protein
MCDTPKARLNTTDHKRYCPAESFADSLTVYDDTSIRAHTAYTTWRISVIITHTTVRGVTIDEGVHISTGDPKEEIRLSELLKRIRALPIWL